MYKFARDNDGHWYLIQAKHQRMFEKWVEAMENGQDFLVDFSDTMIGSDPTAYVMREKPELYD